MSISADSAMSFSAVFNAVQIIAGTVASLPLILYRRVDEHNKERFVNHPLYDILHNAPNSEMTAFVFKEIMQQSLLMHGNACAEIIRDTTGRTIALWPWNWQKVKIQRGEDKKLYYELDQGDNKKITRRAEDVLHIPGLGFDGRIGYSVVSRARESMGLGLGMEEFQARFYGSGTNLGGALTHPGKLGEQALKNLKKSVKEGYTGLGKSHGMLILEEGMKYEKFGMPLEDAQFLECVVPDTFVTMADGSRRRAGALRTGEMVLAWNGSKLVGARLAAAGNRQTKQLIKIKTARGRELVASADHPVLKLDKMRTPGGRPAKEKDVWRRMSDLHPGDYVRVALGSAETTDSPKFEEAYFFGALVGDGYIRTNETSLTTVSPQIAEKVATFIRTQGGELRRRPERDSWYVATGGLGRGGSKLRKLMNASGLIGKHSRTKDVPDLVIQGGPPAWAGFLSGYFDTDGSIRDPNGKRNPAAYWSSINRGLLQNCQHLLSLFGIQSAIYNMSNGGQKLVCGHLCETQPGFGLYVMGISQMKKLAAILQLAHEEKKRRLAGYVPKENSRYRAANFNYDRIIHVEDVGNGETVGLEVNGSHTHVTNGIITHNSRVFQIGEICRWFNLPPHKLKELSKATFSNIEQQQIEFVQDSIRPWLVRWEQHISWKLLSADERKNYFAEFLIDALLRGDTESRNKAYATMRQWGIINADEWRRLENMNPIGGKAGSSYILPLAYIEAGAEPPEPKAKEPFTPKQEEESKPVNFELRALRSLKARRRTAEAYKEVFRAVEKDILSKEIPAIKKIARKALKQRTSAEFIDEMGKYYTEFKSYVRERFTGLFETYGEAIYPLAAEEIGARPELTDEYKAWVSEYSDHSTNRYIESSRGQMKTLAMKHRENDALAAIEDRMTEWEEKRPDKFAGLETVNAESGTASFVYFAGGFRTVWVTFDESCPYCASLDGMTISRGQSFINAGQSFQPTGAEVPLIVTQNISHPSAHEGCDCSVRADIGRSARQIEDAEEKPAAQNIEINLTVDNAGKPSKKKIQLKRDNKGNIDTAEVIEDSGDGK